MDSKLILRIIIIVYCHLLFIDCNKDDCKNKQNIYFKIPDTAWFNDGKTYSEFLFLSTDSFRQTLVTTKKASNSFTEFTNFNSSLKGCDNYFGEVRFANTYTTITSLGFGGGVNFNPTNGTYQLELRYDLERKDSYSDLEKIEMKLNDTSMIFSNHIYNSYNNNDYIGKAIFYTNYINPRGISFKNVYQFDLLAADTSLFLNSPTKLILSKELGLIGYELNTGQKWFIQKL